MRPTLLLRAGQYTPRIQFMGTKWREAKRESTADEVLLVMSKVMYHYKRGEVSSSEGHAIETTILPL